MLYSPLRESTTRGPHDRFTLEFVVKLYDVLFRQDFFSDTRVAIEHTSAMPSSDSPSVVETPQPEASSAPEQTQDAKGKQPEIAQQVTPATDGSQSKVNGKPVQNAKDSTSASNKKLTAAELKKKAKEEKAARRAQTVAAKEAESIPAVAHAPAAGSSTGPPSVGSQQQKGEGQKGAKTQQRAGGPVSAAPRNSALRGSQKTTAAPAAPAAPKKEDKTVEFFRHLYRPRTTTIADASKEVHPAVLALGLQMGNYTICGSCARLVAMLQAFKRVSISACLPSELATILIITGN